LTTLSPRASFGIFSAEAFPESDEPPPPQAASTKAEKTVTPKNLIFITPSKLLIIACIKQADFI
jgi:hypothetical protein